MRHPHYECLAKVRATTRNTDALIRDIKRRYERSDISETEAIETLRSVGACEPEIREALAA